MVGEWVGVLTQAGIYAIVVLALQLALRSGSFSVMHASLLGVGAYVTGFCEMTLGMNGWLGGAIAILAAAVVGLVAAILLTRLEGLFFAIGTLALGEMLSFAVQVIPNFGGAGGLSGISLSTTGWWVAAAVVVVAIVVILWERTNGGLAVYVVGKDPVVAASLGLRVRLSRIIIFTVSSAIAGLAGVLYAHYVGLIQPPDLAFSAETNLLLFLVVGGVDTPIGALAGTFGISILFQLLSISQLDRYWIFGVLLVVIVILRPRGIIPRMTVKARGVDALLTESVEA